MYQDLAYCFAVFVGILGAFCWGMARAWPTTEGKGAARLLSIFKKTLSLVIFAAVFCVFSAGLYAFKRQPVLNPQTRRPDPFLRDWINSATSFRGSFVHINMGDRAGGLGTDDDARLTLYLLSPVLRRYPLVDRFLVSWSYTVAMGTDEFEIVYSRRNRTLTHRSGGRGDPVVDRGSIPGVTDAAIHAAARCYKSYEDLRYNTLP